MAREIMNGERKGRSIGPLRRLVPYLARYRALVIGALISLVAAAVTTLTLPIAVRRMIDHGFSETNSGRSEEHTSELQSRENLVCRRLLEKKQVDDPHVHRAAADRERELRARPVGGDAPPVDELDPRGEHVGLRAVVGGGPGRRTGAVEVA